MAGRTTLLVLLVVQLTNCNNVTDVPTTNSTRSPVTNSTDSVVLRVRAPNHADAVVPTLPPLPVVRAMGPDGPGCTNDPLQVWSDVIFLIESAGEKNSNFENMWFSVVALSESFTIESHGYPFPHYMQVGVIVYGDSAVTVAPLGSINSLYNVNPPFVGSKTGATDLADGITQAYNELHGPNSRPNARKVIYLVADDLNTSGFSDPKQVSDHFKLDGGIIIGRAVKPEHGPIPENLAQIASPGYFLNENSTVTDEVSAITDTNCFCRVGSKAFTTIGLRELPTAGCYTPISLQYTYQTATSLCRLRHSGYIASIQSDAKSRFLRSLLPGQVIWTGLSYNGGWQWQDGTYLGNYKPWAVIPNTNQHAMMHVDGMWYAADIKSSIPFLVCEAAPCDSENYCEEP